MSWVELCLLKGTLESSPRVPLTETLFSFSGGSDGKASASNAGDPGSIPGSQRSPGEEKRQPTPVFSPGEFHGQRSLLGYSLWGLKESGKTERLTLSLLSQRSDQVKMRSCWIKVVPKSSAWCPYRRRRICRSKQRRKKTTCKQRQRPELMLLQGEEKQRKDFSAEPSEGAWPWNTLISDTWPPKHWEDKFLLF